MAGAKHVHIYDSEKEQHENANSNTKQMAHRKRVIQEYRRPIQIKRCIRIHARLRGRSTVSPCWQPQPLSYGYVANCLHRLQPL